MDDIEIEEIIAEESYTTFDSLMDFLRSGYQNLTFSINFISYLIQSYAWHMVFGGIVFYYIFTKFLKPFLESFYGSYDSYKKRSQEREYDAKYHKDPDVFSARISAQQEYAQKLQEKYDQEAKEHLAKLKEKQEKKRQEVENMLNNSGDGGHKLGRTNNTNNSSTSKSLRPEYNPLMGQGSSSNYRPPKKSKCGGGGCEK